MSASGGSHSQESSALPPARQSQMLEIDPAQREFCRKLLGVLADIVNEKDYTSGNGGALPSATPWSKDEARRDVERGGASGKSPLPPPSVELGRREKTDPFDEAKNCIRLKRLCEDYEHLNDRILSSLRALGGRGRTIIAMKGMRDAVIGIRKKFAINDKDVTLLHPHSCVKCLEDCSKAAIEVHDAFQELGVYNKRFFDSLKILPEHLKEILAKVDAEYGMYEKCAIDRYLDSNFGPLVEDFEILITELVNVAEKEIAAIRLSQDFRSQRYLNLTTIATFLSSVTATTLQITTGGSDDRSASTAVTNSMWLISLVFSTASAVYSLLVMTWYQSSVSDPKEILSRPFRIWFRKGPMYALIVALLTFSIGLCILSFRIASAAGVLFSAAFPTLFAGIHAYAIVILCSWFLRVQWKANHTRRFPKTGNARLMSLGRHLDIFKDRGRRAMHNLDLGNVHARGLRLKNRLTELLKSLRIEPPALGRPSRQSPPEGNEKDIERGQSAPDGHIDSQEATPGLVKPSAEHETFEHGAVLGIPGGISATDGDEPETQIHDISPLSIPDQADDRHSDSGAGEKGSVATVQDSAAPTNESVSEIGSGSAEPKEDEYKPFKSLLQFSPTGRLLACAHKNTVTIYRVVESFSTFKAFKTPDGGHVRQISWNPVAFDDRAWQKNKPPGELLVRSSGSVSVWNVSYLRPSEARMVGHLNRVISPAQWTDENNVAVEDGRATSRLEEGYFVCATGTIVRLYNEKCEELRSIDTSELLEVEIDQVLHATFFLKKYLICVVHPKNDRCDWQYVVNVEDNLIFKEKRIFSGHTSLSLSSLTRTVLLHGSELGAQLLDFSTDELGADHGTRQLVLGPATPAQQKFGAKGSGKISLSFHGFCDKMIAGYSAGDIVILYHKYHNKDLAAMHIFNTPDDEAIPRNPVGFAINRGFLSEPYMFAFSDKNGNVTVWSLQSNTQLLNCPSARTFEVHDHRGGGRVDPDKITGRLLILPQPANPA